MNPLDMTGRTVMVTGASSGIGRATAELLGRLGGRVVLVARNRDRLEAVRGGLEGHDHVVEPFDLQDCEAVPDWMRRVASVCGPLDGLVHSAGVQMTAPLRAIHENEVERLWRVNVSAGLWLARGYRQRGVNRSGGSIVFLSSVAALVGAPGLSVYAASKGAVLSMTRALALELAREGIRVNSVAPGYVRTEMLDAFLRTLSPEQILDAERRYPLGFGEPLDVANAVAYLLSAAARWVTGTTLVLDGGLSAH